MVDGVAAARLASRNAILAPTPELTEEVVAELAEVEAAFQAAAEDYLAADPDASSAPSSSRPPPATTRT